MADTYISNVVPYGHYNDTDTLYGIVRNMSSQARDVANGAWDTWNNSDIGDYDISAGVAAGFLWVGDFPVEAVNGYYVYQVRIRAGGSPASGDIVVYSRLGYWNGTTFLTPTDAQYVVGATPITLANINAECDTALSDINLDHLLKVDTTVAADGDLESYVVAGSVMAHLMAVAADATAYKASTDSLEASRVHADTIKAETAVLNAFWNVLILVSGTIGATGNDTTHLHLTGLTYGDDELNDYLIITYDVSETEYHSSWVLDWDNTSALATVSTLAFTPQDSTDQYWIIAIRKHPDVSDIKTKVDTMAAGGGVPTLGD
jgi:hypothetical protein